jgi:hypothetical protein
MTIAIRRIKYWIIDGNIGSEGWRRIEWESDEYRPELNSRKVSIKMEKWHI